MNTPAENQLLLQRTHEAICSTATLVSLNTDGSSSARGSGAFVVVNGSPYLLTADHVAARLAEANNPVLFGPPVSSAGIVEPGRLVIAPPHVLKPFQVSWRSEAMDVALVKLPRALRDLSYLHWHDLCADAPLVTRVSTTWEEHDDENWSLPFCLAGAPNFGVFTECVERAAVVGVVCLHGRPYVWPSMQPHQMILDFDADGVLPGLDMTSRAVAERLINWENPSEPMGGYSGGPVFLLGRDRILLVGCETDAMRLNGAPVVYATSADAIVNAL